MEKIREIAVEEHNGGNEENTEYSHESDHDEIESILFNDLGSINLKEAEDLANEGTVFLTENDLFEGLEDFDLIPLEDNFDIDKNDHSFQNEDEYMRLYGEFQDDIDQKNEFNDVSLIADEELSIPVKVGVSSSNETRCVKHEEENNIYPNHEFQVNDDGSYLEDIEIDDIHNNCIEDSINENDDDQKFDNINADQDNLENIQINIDLDNEIEDKVEPDKIQQEVVLSAEEVHNEPVNHEKNVNNYEELEIPDENSEEEKNEIIGLTEKDLQDFDFNELEIDEPGEENINTGENIDASLLEKQSESLDSVKDAPAFEVEEEYDLDELESNLEKNEMEYDLGNEPQHLDDNEAELEDIVINDIQSSENVENDENSNDLSQLEIDQRENHIENNDSDNVEPDSIQNNTQLMSAAEASTGPKEYNGSGSSNSFSDDDNDFYVVELDFEDGEERMHDDQKNAQKQMHDDYQEIVEDEEDEDIDTYLDAVEQKLGTDQTVVQEKSEEEFIVEELPLEMVEQVEENSLEQEIQEQRLDEVELIAEDSIEEIVEQTEESDFEHEVEEISLGEEELIVEELPVEIVGQVEENSLEHEVLEQRLDEVELIVEDATEEIVEQTEESDFEHEVIEISLDEEELTVEEFPEEKVERVEENSLDHEVLEERLDQVELIVEDSTEEIIEQTEESDFEHEVVEISLGEEELIVDGFPEEKVEQIEEISLEEEVLLEELPVEVPEQEVGDIDSELNQIDLDEIPIYNKDELEKPEFIETDHENIIVKETSDVEVDIDSIDSPMVEEDFEKITADDEMVETYKSFDQELAGGIDSEISIDEPNEKVVFIDDKEKLDGDERGTIVEDDKLDKVTSKIVEGIEGESKVLREATLEEDKNKIANMLTGVMPVFEDLLLDFEDEYKYKDDELDFVKTAIIGDEYRDYIREIDEFSGIKKRKIITKAIELLGLTPDEIEFIQDRLFEADYKDINLNEIFDYFGTDFDLMDQGSAKDRNITYLLPKENSLNEEERISIEEDIRSLNALIFEEDIDEIKNLFKRMLGKDRVKAKKDPIQEVEEIESIPEVENQEVIEEEIDDITDRVVILEDEDDMERFIQQFPFEKRDELKGLFKYLDGLFEKLPESTIKNFAKSEYFDLYVKVLDELGI